MKRSRISLSASLRASRRRPPALPGPISPDRMTVDQKRGASTPIERAWVVMGSIMPQAVGYTGARVSYVHPVTGQTYPLTEARWCADDGHYLNLAPAPGLRRADIDTARRSVWRYAAALLVDVGHAISLGEGWTPIVRGQWNGV